MGRFFLIALAVAGSTAGLLFFPIYLEGDLYYDMNRNKLLFALYGYKVVKIVGGYVTSYPGGVALHISSKKAILLPYTGMEKERKRFSFATAFKIVSLSLATETGAEYLLPVSLAHTFLRTFFFTIGGNRDKIRNVLWLTDGDALRVSLRIVVFFNLFILLGAFIKPLKEKIKNLWRKKTKKSIV